MFHEKEAHCTFLRYTQLGIYLFIYLVIYLSIYLPIYLFIYLFIYLYSNANKNKYMLIKGNLNHITFKGNKI